MSFRLRGHPVGVVRDADSVGHRWAHISQSTAESWAPRQSAGNDDCRQRLASMIVTFGSPEIGTRSLVASPCTGPAEPEMKRHRNLVHRFAVESHRPHPAANECARLDCAAQTDNANVIAIVDLEFGRELRRHFGEQLRLQFREMTVRSATSRRQCDARSDDRSLGHKEIADRPAARNDFHGA